MRRTSTTRWRACSLTSVWSWWSCDGQWLGMQLIRLSLHLVGSAVWCVSSLLRFRANSSGVSSFRPNMAFHLFARTWKVGKKCLFLCSSRNAAAISSSRGTVSCWPIALCRSYPANYPGNDPSALLWYLQSLVVHTLPQRTVVDTIRGLCA